jgi:hypothetical protein
LTSPSKLDVNDLADDFIDDYSYDDYINIVSRWIPTRHQAGMPTTMPNALRGMYLLVTTLRDKWSRSIGIKTNAR